MSRIEPLAPPYTPAVAERLAQMMPSGIPPIGLFRTFAKNLPMATAMADWGGYELSRHLSLPMRDREILIDRTCATCRCEYEWGVHIAFFADRVGLTPEQVVSLSHGHATDPCWTEGRDRLLIQGADSLHQTSSIGDDLWHQMTDTFSEDQLLDLTMVCGWYHAISFTANAAQVSFEHGAPRFDDHT